MAIHITDDCVSCGACEDECPNTAISLGDGIFVIDPELCTECVGFYDAPSCQDACPVDCCLPDPVRVESEDTLFGRARQLHPGEAAELTLSPDTSHFRAATASV
jgi:ferredoxin